MSQPAPLPLLSCLSWSGSQVTFYWSLPPGAATCHTTRHLPQRSIRCYTHHAPWQKLSASPLSPSPTAHNRTSVAASDSTSTFPTSVHLSQSRVAALVRADVHISGMTLTSPWWVSLIPTCSTIQSLGLTGLISFESKGLSGVFSKATVQKHQFFGAQPSSQSNSHIHTWPQEKP